MSNTIMTAKNTFSEGLVMDFAPDNTLANTLTSALNATLLTFNGNEMSLLNDMGNGRVETARLPDGYVPVGTCEFGDIIYIVSYNPITNKSLVGCFPSPERNISTEELGGVKQNLNWKDFQEEDINNWGNPSGELKTTSVKKILFNNYMHSGDKYIIYAKDLDTNSSNVNFSDFGNTSHEHGSFPKFLKIHIVSIEDSGKIVFLDSSVKWYELGQNKDFYLLTTTEIPNKTQDLDAYRTMVSSAYSIFLSKVSGKLALLVELERIKGFSCTWEAFVKPHTTEGYYDYDLLYTDYMIYWNFNWETEDPNINPSSIVLTKSEWSGEHELYKGKYLKWIKNDTNQYELGGPKGTQWLDTNIQLPLAYNSYNCYYSNINRKYVPETYKGTYKNFITKDCYQVLASKEALKDLAINNNPVKLNRSYLIQEDTKNIFYIKPEIGKYYVNCSSISKKDDKYLYYSINVDLKLEEITAKEISDDIVNNTFKYPITKEFSEFAIPVKLNTDDGVKNLNINNLIYHYEMTPAMPYGLLREYSLDGYIDFKKLGTKSIKLNTWKYYNYENTSTLTWGMEAYTEPNKGISEVIFEFYDNQGLAACFKNNNKSSYNGKFTEYLLLNSTGNSYKLVNKDSKGIDFYHKGLEVTKDNAEKSQFYITTISDEKGSRLAPIKYEDMQAGETYYTNDAGTIYSNCLYLVKIIIKYCDKDMLGNYIENENSIITDFRWYWTNHMFNEYYYSVLDFKDLKFNLTLDCDAVFLTDLNTWDLKTSEYKAADSYNELINNTNINKSLSATILYINQNKDVDNVKMAIRAGLQNTFNTFNLEKTALNTINTRIFLGKDQIINDPEQPAIKFSKEELPIFEGVYPTNSKLLTGKVNTEKVSKTLTDILKLETDGKGEELYNSKTSYLNYENNFKLNTSKYSEKRGNEENTNNLLYINENGQLTLKPAEYIEYDTTLDTVWYDEQLLKIVNYYPLLFSGIYYSKYYYFNSKSSKALKILKSFITNINDLSSYTLAVNSSNKIQYNKMYLCSAMDKSGASSHISGAIVEFKDNNATNVTDLALTEGSGDRNIPILETFDSNSTLVHNNFNFFFPFGFGYSWGDSPREVYYNNVKISNNKYVNTGNYSDMDLGGTLAVVTSSGKTEVGEHYGNTKINSDINSLTKFTPYILGILTLLFYLSDASEEIINYFPNNYVYLDTNKIKYRRDIIVELTSTSQNKLLVFRGIKYDEYLLAVCKNFNSELMKENNVQVNFSSCLKSFPIEFEFQYIKPESEIFTNMIENYTIIKSIYDDLPKTTYQSFNKGSVYGYDYTTKTFKHVHDIFKLKCVQNYNISEGNITANYVSLPNNNFHIDNIKDLLNVKNDKLVLSGVPTSSGTYSLKTHKKRSITDFKNNLKFYADNTVD